MEKSLCPIFCLLAKLFHSNFGAFPPCSFLSALTNGIPEPSLENKAGEKELQEGKNVEMPSFSPGKLHVVSQKKSVQRILSDKVLRCEHSQDSETCSPAGFGKLLTYHYVLCLAVMKLSSEALLVQWNRLRCLSSRTHCSAL